MDEDEEQSVDQVLGDMVSLWDDSEEQKNVPNEEKEEYEDYVPQPPDDVDLTIF